jgi:hypothetical protein
VKAPATPAPARRAVVTVPATTAPRISTGRAAGPSVLEGAERLRDDVLQSKLSHPDPWTYTPKARGWADRAQALVDRLASGEPETAARQALDALRAEVEADRDFQDARRLF